jgi:hypothetical protein
VTYEQNEQPNPSDLSDVITDAARFTYQQPRPPVGEAMAHWTAPDGKEHWGLCHPSDWWASPRGSRVTSFYPWRFERTNLTLTHAEPQTGFCEIDLEKIRTTGDAVRWVEYVNRRGWADPPTVRCLAATLEVIFGLWHGYLGEVVMGHRSEWRRVKLGPSWRRR